MTFLSDVSAAVDGVATGVASGDITKVQAQVEQLKKVLHDNARTLGNEDFQALQLTATAFGHLPAADLLGNEHRLAHAVIADTIIGVGHDLQGFGDGVETFARGIDEADLTSADDLQRREGAVDALLASAASSEGDRRNAIARGEYLSDGEES
jgi:hypothetical protein